MPILESVNYRELDNHGWVIIQSGPAASLDKTMLDIAQSLGEPAPDTWPKLAGQQAPYLERQLLAYKRNQRSNAVMQFHLRDTREEDYKALAAYFSQAQP